MLAIDGFWGVVVDVLLWTLLIFCLLVTSLSLLFSPVPRLGARPKPPEPAKEALEPPEDAAEVDIAMEQDEDDVEELDDVNKQAVAH